MEMREGLPLFVYIEAAGSIVGLVLTVVMIRLVREFGGAIGAALRNLVIGVVLFTAAFTISTIIDWFQLAAMQNSMTTHMSLMVLAMIMIVLTANKFARLVK